jgi:hypothetical protein
MSEDLPACAWLDLDNDKMRLVKGEKKYALIDSGQGRKLGEYLFTVHRRPAD